MKSKLFPTETKVARQARTWCVSSLILAPVFMLLINNSVFSMASGNNLSIDSRRPIDKVEQDTIQEEITQMIQVAMQKNNIPALSIGIIMDGQISFTSGFGSLRRKSSNTIIPNSVFQIASLSKLLTGLIARRMEYDNLIDLNDPILNYLPSKTSWYPENLQDVKIKHLLLHNSGLPRNSLVLQRTDGEPMRNGYSRTQVLQDLKKLELESIPGQKYEYSNLGYAVLGLILEEASGLPYSDLLEKYVTKPYNMEFTVSQSKQVNKAHLVTPYRKDNREIQTSIWKTGKLTPASGIFSNIKDLSFLMTLQLRAYRECNNDALILTGEKEGRGKQGSYYGYGIFVDETKRGTIYGHRGDMDGFSSEYIFNPERNVGVVLLTSSGGRWAGLLAAEIMKILEENSNSK